MKSNTVTKDKKDKERQLRHDNYRQMLEAKFGFTEFRDNQIQIIDSVVHDRKDTVCIMSTGAGKSLGYQLPALVMEKSSIIISPLISLMEDQKVGLEKKGITACCYNSSQPNRSKLMMNILENKYQVIYLTPETAVKSQDMLQQFEETHGISLIAIDESHCVSLWGADFRPKYRELSCLKEWFPHIPMMALTGTATKLVEDDIITTLNLMDPVIYKSSFDRPNLSFHVKTKKHVLTDLLPHFLDDAGEPHSNSIIVYCQTKKDTENIAMLLQSKDIKCDAYHAGIDSKKRTEVHHQFLENELTTIVSTIAFGMGIDKEDIRKIIHYGCPKDMESYYQETGRAGRDGKQSDCYVYYARSDFATSKFFLKEIRDDRRRTHQESMIKAMEKYLFSTECRRKQILAYFDEELTEQNPNCCDNCLSGKEQKKHDFGPQALLCLGLVKKCTFSFGMTNLIGILRGANNKKIPADVKKYSFYGAGKEYSVEWWKCLFQQLLNADYLKQKTKLGSFGATIVLGKLAPDWLMKNKTDPELELTLTEEMQDVMGDKPLIKINTKKTVPTGPTFDVTYDMFQNQKKDLSSICKERALKIDTLHEHITRFIKQGDELDYDRIELTQQQYEDVIRVTYSEPINGDTDQLATIKEACPKGITYGHIKMSLAIFETDPCLSEKLEKPEEKEVITIKKKKRVMVV